GSAAWLLGCACGGRRAVVRERARGAPLPKRGAPLGVLAVRAGLRGRRGRRLAPQPIVAWELTLGGPVARTLGQGPLPRGLPVSASESFFAMRGTDRCCDPDERDVVLGGVVDECSVPVLVPMLVVGCEAQELTGATADVRPGFLDEGAQGSV